MQLTDKDILLHLSISRITFLKFFEKKILLENIDSADKLSLSSINDIENLIGRNLTKAVWNGKENFHCAEIALHFCRTLGIQVVLFSEEDYPEALHQIDDCPYLLFCRGDVRILKNRCVSVVGTRRLTTAGKIAARQFAYDAVIDGCNVISGLANGADGFAHQGAIDAYFDYLERDGNPIVLGKTIAVLPSSIDEILPASHKRMAAQIIQSGGLLVSEYEPGMGMAKWHYVERNRIIAALSPATVVIEAPAGSGALITADFALEYGRDVMFHEIAFCENAQKVSHLVYTDLEKAHAKGTVSRYKLENTPEKYLEAGAPVVKNYKDYCSALVEAPGQRKNIPKQGELF